MRASPFNHASELALAIYSAGLDAVRPIPLIRRACVLDGSLVQLQGRTYDLDDYRRVLVCGAGKASCGLAQAVLGVLGDRVTGGLLVTKLGSAIPVGHLRVLEASHPAPDESSLYAGEQMLQFATNCSEGDLVLFLLSGGASSLIEAPIEGVDLMAIREVTLKMMLGGADIHALNTVRSQLSRIKGGGLAAAFGPATVVCLVLSDVIGNDFSVIGSGPLWGTSQSAADARQIASQYGIDLPTVSPRPKLSATPHLLLGDLSFAMDAAAQAARALGLEVQRIDQALTGEAREEAVIFATHLADTPTCFLSGGETVVTVKGVGKGGRCQEFACAAAPYLAGRQDCALLAGSTDGSDGPTDVAGALVDAGSAKRALTTGKTVDLALENNASFDFLEACHGLVYTGPTQSNVNDLYLMVFGKSVSS